MLKSIQLYRVTWSTLYVLVVVGCSLNLIRGVSSDDNIEDLGKVEEYYKWRKLVESPVQNGYSTGPTVAIPRLVEVDRSEWAWRKPEHQKTAQVDQIVLPYEGFQYDPSKHLKQSYVIENKRFVEDLTRRCTVSTVPKNPMDSEPSFVIVSSSGDIRVEATIPAEFIKKAGFDPNKNTVIIVHGYTQAYPFSPYMREMRALFDGTNHLDKMNLIFIDYSIISWLSYQQTAAHSGLIGSFLANFIFKLIELGADPKSIHLIGNSLGAQISSLAGKRIRPAIGKITVVDSAGPCFGRLGEASSDPNHRVSPKDADQVIVLHYDDSFIGLPGQFGDVDIYVNGGSDQPGCKMTAGHMFSGMKSMILKEDRYVESSHTRGQDLITAPLPDWCQQVAYECASYQSFTRGECGYCNDNNDQCYLMSMSFQYKSPIDESLNRHFNGTKLYISTDAKSPYCSNHFQILVKLDPAVGFKKFKEASLELLGDDGEAVSVVVSNRNAPSELSYLLLTDKPPTQFKWAKMELSPSKVTAAISSEKLARDAVTVEVNYMSNIDPEVRKSFSSRLCFDRVQDDSMSLINCK